MNKTGKGQRAIGYRSKGIYVRALNYSSTVLYRLLPIAFCLLLIGCGGYKEPTLSDTQLKAAEFNQRAESAFKKGSYRRALNLYNEALKINRSIENIDGTAINIVSASAVYRKLGDKESAHKYLDEILNATAVTYRPMHISDAAFLKALLQLDEGKYDSAKDWTDRSLSSCDNPQCQGKIYNIWGRIELLKGDLTSAITYGNKGLSLNKSNEDEAETANSLRLIAEAKAAKGEYSEAIKFYEDALSIDKKLEASRKIAMDLVGIGTTFFKQKMCGDAVKYYQRALSVIEGLGDVQGAKEIVEMINKCSQTSSKNPDKK
ncbi:MAG: tetratricopeptide repeat protein [Nitrospirae bacterium]|nr:tetratricopeptide repeat protein [Nitrospirota bacterium]